MQLLIKKSLSKKGIFSGGMSAHVQLVLTPEEQSVYKDYNDFVDTYAYGQNASWSMGDFINGHNVAAGNMGDMYNKIELVKKAAGYFSAQLSALAGWAGDTTIDL